MRIKKLHNDHQVNVMDYMPKVKKIAKQMYYKYGCGAYGIDVEDLEQEGFKGLCDAYKKYEPELNPKFWPYAKMRVKGDMIDFLRKSQIINVPQPKKEKLKQLKQEISNLSKKLGRQPNDEDLSNEMGCSIAEVHKIKQNDVLIESNSVEHAEQINIHDEYMKEIIYQNMDECIESLPSKADKLLLMQRIIEKVPLQKLAISFRVSHQTISRREKELLLQLRDCMNKKESTIEDIQYIL